MISGQVIHRTLITVKFVLNRIPSQGHMVMQIGTSWWKQLLLLTNRYQEGRNAFRTLGTEL